MLKRSIFAKKNGQMKKDFEEKEMVMIEKHYFANNNASPSR